MFLPMWLIVLVGLGVLMALCGAGRGSDPDGEDVPMMVLVLVVPLVALVALVTLPWLVGWWTNEALAALAAAAADPDIEAFKTQIGFVPDKREVSEFDNWLTGLAVLVPLSAVGVLVWAGWKDAQDRAKRRGAWLDPLRGAKTDD